MRRCSCRGRRPRCWRRLRHPGRHRRGAVAARPVHRHRSAGDDDSPPRQHARRRHRHGRVRRRTTCRPRPVTPAARSTGSRSSSSPDAAADVQAGADRRQGGPADRGAAGRTRASPEVTIKVARGRHARTQRASSSRPATTGRASYKLRLGAGRRPAGPVRHQRAARSCCSATPRSTASTSPAHDLLLEPGPHRPGARTCGTCRPACRSSSSPPMVIDWLTSGPSPWLADVVDPLPEGTKLIGNVPAISNEHAADQPQRPGGAAGRPGRRSTGCRSSCGGRCGPNLPGTLELTVEHQAGAAVTPAPDYLTSNVAYRPGRPSRNGSWSTTGRSAGWPGRSTPASRCRCSAPRTNRDVRIAAMSTSGDRTRTRRWWSTSAAASRRCGSASAAARRAGHPAPDRAAGPARPAGLGESPARRRMTGTHRADHRRRQAVQLRGRRLAAGRSTGPAARAGSPRCRSRRTRTGSPWSPAAGSTVAALSSGRRHPAVLSRT